MRSFLEEISDYILSNYSDLRSLNIIVPNRRTGLFIKKNISELTDQTIWLPQITPVQDIFYSNSTLNSAEEVLLIYKLYRIFIKHTGSNESFDDFYYWGEIILSDFDDIDKYLVDAEKLFSTVADIKEIDKIFDGYEEESIEIIKKFWFNVNQAQISSHKESFLDLWKSMYNIYSQFKNELKQDNIAYQGMIYRDVAENLNNDNFTHENYVIVGFNALNKCEKQLFNHLKSQFNTIFFWDADNYYLKDKYQEAGRFIRENIRKYPSIDNIGISDYIKDDQKNIEVIMTPSTVSQTKLIPEIISKWEGEHDYNPEKTAIVLGDENLLIPLMYSIPDSVSTYNISMGYSVKNSMTAAFISHLINLQQNKRIKKDECNFYYKNVISILEHSFLKILEPESENIKEHISSNKMIYASRSEFQVSELLKTIFQAAGDTNELASYVPDVLYAVLQRIIGIDDLIMEVEVLNKIIERLNALKDCIIYDNITFESDKVYNKLLNSILRNLSVAFEGEPLKGLQVLGFLETRSLDFDRVIMLSLNEGVFPKTSVAESLIPYNLRKFHELPSIEFQDSIFAYYFYRLLQRSKDVKIIYSNQAGDGASEPSRFISQIKYELNKEIKFSTKAYKIEIDSKKVVLGKKNPKIISKIEEHLKNGISPKAINQYIDCKFSYYLEYIEKIKEPDKLEEEGDAILFGRLFHEIMYELYQPYLNKPLEEEDFNKFTNEKINIALNTAIENVLETQSKEQIEAFKNKIIVEIALKYIKLQLDFDKHNTPLTINSLEASEKIEIPISKYNINASIKGIIDRVDIKDKTIRVLDYKTGKTEISFKDVDSLFSEDRKTGAKIVTQILLYALIYQNKSNSFVCPGIMNINNLGKDYDYRLSYNRKRLDNINSEIINDLNENLIEMFEEMLDTTQHFTQTENEKKCQYCPYKVICNR